MVALPGRRVGSRALMGASVCATSLAAGSTAYPAFDVGQESQIPIRSEPPVHIPGVHLGVTEVIVAYATAP
jgi:hypothetical protein